MYYEQYENQPVQDRTGSFNRYLAKTYGMMAIGLLVTFLVALATALFMPVAAWSLPLSIVLLVLEVITVIALGRAVHRAGYGAVIGMFLFYSFLTGMSLSYIFLIYDFSRICLCFAAAALSFAIMSLIGLNTQRDLSRFGLIFIGGIVGLLFLSLIGAIISVVSGTSVWLEIGICILGLILFLGVTAFDTQRLKAQYESFGDGEMGKKLAVYSALQLYLDFINIFVYLLRLFGRSRD